MALPRPDVLVLSGELRIRTTSAEMAVCGKHDVRTNAALPSVLQDAGR
jgi:hypothetical protein